MTTWPPDAWKVGGGSMLGLDLLRSGLNLVYHGTGNPGPWNPDLRPGDNKWTSGIFARDPDSGARTVVLSDGARTTSTTMMASTNKILLGHDVEGRAAKSARFRPERNGYIYVLDRTTGEVLSAEPFGLLIRAKGVDLKKQGG